MQQVRGTQDATTKSVSVVQPDLANHAGRDRGTGLTGHGGTAEGAGEVVATARVAWWRGGVHSRQIASPRAGEPWPGVAGSGRARALTPGGGRERQALPAWYRGVWCPPLRPLKKLAALEFSVRRAFPSRWKLARLGAPGSPLPQPG